MVVRRKAVKKVRRSTATISKRTHKPYKQTGVRKSLKKDRKIKAKPPGRRISASGNKYTETRKNRSDAKGSRI